MNELVKIDVEKEIKSALEYSGNSLSENTMRSYRSQWSTFCDWCDARGFTSSPASPEVLCVFFSWLADNGYKRSTIERFKFVVSKSHVTAGLEDPTKAEMIATNLHGIFRQIGSTIDTVDPLSEDTLRKIVEKFGGASQEHVRNRALALIGFFSAGRRSETSSLLRKNVKIVEGGMTIKLDRSKTDSEGHGFVKSIERKKSVQLCPVAAIVDWLAVAPESKFLFCHVAKKGGRGSAKEGQRLSDKMIARLIAKWASDVGDKSRIAGHSYRSGFATAAARAGKSNRAIMKITGHKSNDMVDRYVREANPFVDNATSGLLGD